MTNTRSKIHIHISLFLLLLINNQLNASILSLLKTGLPILGGSALIYCCFAFEDKFEEETAQELIHKLQEKIEKRRKNIATAIQKLENELATFVSSSNHINIAERTKLLEKLHQAQEELRLIDFDYSIEYARTSPRAREITNGGLGLLIVAGIVSILWGISHYK